MEILNLSAGKLRDLIKLVERRDALTSELKKLEAALVSLTSGKPAPAPKPATTRKRRKGGRPKAVKLVAPAAKAPEAPKATPAANGVKAAKAPKAKAAKAPQAKGTGRRGKLKASILAILKTAGPEGIAVKDVAAKLNAKPQNIHVWFSSTGKNVPGLVRVSEGRYGLKG